jgi:hypothetical protein
LAGIDLDTCRDPATGHVEPWAQEVLDRLSTYSEVSPSGTGIKAFLLIDPADIEALRAIMHTQHGRQFKRSNGSAHPPAIELYVSNRYFAVTWQAYDDTPNELRLVPLRDLRWLVEEVGPAFAGKAGSGGASDNTVLARLNQAAAHNKAVNTAIRNAATMKGGSRSEGALGLGSALKRAGWSYVDMRAALLACPATREWATEAQAEGERQFKRIWDKAAAPEAWPEPVDCFVDLASAPAIVTEDEAPPALWPFISDTAERMGVATSSVTLAAIISCSSVISEKWRIQPKRRDWSWTETSILWGALVGPPAVGKTPVIRACSAPIEAMERAERERWQEDHDVWKREHEAWKEAKKNKDSDPGDEPPRPRCNRRLVESFTMEALQEVLRDDEKAQFSCPAAKVLCRQNELSELVANLDRYSAGRSGGDRGALLRLNDGGVFSVDRVVRGAFFSPSWAAAILGGIQPEPVQAIAKQSADDGLLQRFCYDVPHPGPMRGEDRPPDRTAIERYNALFPALAALRPASSEGHAQVVVLHANAHACRERIDDLAGLMAALPDTSLRLQSALGKWHGLFARMCLVVHLIDVADLRARGETAPPLHAVPEHTASRVERYMRRVLLPHLMRADTIMFASAQTGHAKWVAGHILAHGLDRIAARDLRGYRPLSAPEARDELSSVMASLVTLGWVDPEPPRNQLNPVSAWRVNPLVHDRFAARAAQERTERQQKTAEVRQKLQAHADAQEAG